MVSVGLHNLPNENSFGHFLALDNVAMQANGTALVRLMDPHTIDQNPAQTGEYRWFTMYPDGTLAWSAAPGTGYYTPASGLVVLDEVQIVSGFHFFGNNPGGNAPEPIASASTVPATRKGGTVPGELRGQTWVGMFVPPPDPDVSGWLLISEVTLQTGHKQRDFQFVTRTALTGGR